MPWGRLIREQLAVDVFYPDQPELTAALGFIAAGPFELSRATTAPVTFDYLDRDDIVTQTMAAFVSTTVNCARCHTHKFDPITQEDYFAMQAIFSSSVEVEVPVITLTEIASWQDQYPLILGLHEARRAYQYFRQRTQGRKLTDEEREEEKRLRDKIVHSVMMRR